MFDLIRYFHFPWCVHLLQANLIVWQYLAFDALAGHFATSVFIAWTFKVFEHEKSLFEVQNKYFKRKISNACKFQRKPMKMPLLLWIPWLTIDIVSQFPNIWIKWIQHILLYCYTSEVALFSYHFCFPYILHYIRQESGYVHFQSMLFKFKTASLEGVGAIVHWCI